MEENRWFMIKNHIQNTIKEIFKDYDIKKLNQYEKRKIIFSYLCNHLNYDYELLYKIKNFNEKKQPVSRDPYLELLSVIHKNKGICNAISQYYKLLLEEIGIESYCVICDDGTTVNHQLNLVYDNEHHCYSFDDITSVIVNRGNNEEYFDYNLEFANEHNQGNKTIFNEERWVILPEEYINYLVGRDKSYTTILDFLPDNILSIKKSTIKF